MTAYRTETEMLTSERIPQTALLYLLLIGGSGAFEYYYSPEHLDTFALVYSIQVILCLGFLGLHRTLQKRGELLPAAIVFWSLLAALVNLYGVLAPVQPELGAMANVMFVTAISVMMPWGIAGQLIVSGVALACFTTTIAFSQDPIVPAPYLIFSLVAGCALSIAGSRSLDLHRLAIFRESTEREDEWEINRTLLEVGATMNSSLDAVDVLDRIAAAVRKAVGLDWGVILLRDEQSNAFRIAGGSSRDSAAFNDLRAMEVPLEAIPMVQRVLDQSYIEIAGPESLEAIDPVSAAYMRQYRFQGLLGTSLVRGGQVVGILAVGTGRTLPHFSDRERQLFQGLAQHAAIALDNVRLVSNLRQADNLKSEFVSTMSHELRTPMNVILGYSDLFLDGAFGTLSDEQNQPLQRLRTSARSLLELINASLEVNRLEAGRSPIETIEFCLLDLLQELERDCEDLPRSPSVALTWDHPLDEVRVRADPRKLKIIVKNLIGNAVKFTAAGQVAVRGRFDPEEETLELRVADTGPGIDGAELPEIFDMFRQAEGGHLRGGVGLGLYIVKRFVDQVGGDIQVSSEVGVGSVFTVTLPAAACETEETVPRAANG